MEKCVKCGRSYNPESSNATEWYILCGSSCAWSFHNDHKMAWESKPSHDYYKRW